MRKMQAVLKAKRGFRNDATYIVLGEDGRNAQGEQSERGPLEVDHCAGI